MMRKSFMLIAIGLFNVSLYAQNNKPIELDNLIKQCQEVVILNDTIRARQNRRGLLKEQLDVLTQNWWRTCNDALSSSACDDNDTRISILDELIGLTDKNYEKNLYNQLIEAKRDPSKRSLTMTGQLSSATSRENSKQRKSSHDVITSPSEEITDPIDHSGDNADAKNAKKGTEDTVVNPIKEERSKEDKAKGKDESSTSPESQDSKKDSSGKEVPTTKKNDAGKDKTKIESKDQTNRNKTIDLFNKNKNQNK